MPQSLRRETSEGHFAFVRDQVQDISLFKLAKSVNVLITLVYSGNKIVYPCARYRTPLQNKEDFHRKLAIYGLDTVISAISSLANSSIGKINELIASLATILN